MGQKLAQGSGSVTSASSSLESNPGGIDLDAGKLNLEIKRNASSALVPEFFGFENFVPIDGLAPMIINVTPITNLPLMLGLFETGAGKENRNLGLVGDFAAKE